MQTKLYIFTNQMQCNTTQLNSFPNSTLLVCFLLIFYCFLLTTKTISKTN